MSDAYDLLVSLRPPVPDEHTWVNSVAGRATLDRVHAAARKPRWWRRKRIIVPTIAIGVGVGLAGGAVAFAPADRQPVANETVFCIGETPAGDAAYYGTGLQPGSGHTQIVAECNATLTPGQEPPIVDWALCVFRPSRDQVGGAEAAVPSTVVITKANNASVCQAAGYDPAG